LTNEQIGDATSLKFVRAIRFLSALRKEGICPVPISAPSLDPRQTDRSFRRRAGDYDGFGSVNAPRVERTWPWTQAFS